MRCECASAHSICSPQLTPFVSLSFSTVFALFTFQFFFRSKHKVVLEFQTFGTKTCSKRMVLAVFRRSFVSLFIALFKLRVDLDVFFIRGGIRIFPFFRLPQKREIVDKIKALKWKRSKWFSLFFVAFDSCWTCALIYRMYCALHIATARALSPSLRSKFVYILDDCNKFWLVWLWTNQI